MIQFFNKNSKMSDNEIKLILETFSVNNVSKLETWLEYNNFVYFNARKLCRLVIYINKTNYRRDSFIMYISRIICETAQRVNDRLNLLTEFIIDYCPINYDVRCNSVFDDLFYSIYDIIRVKTDHTEDELEFMINYFADKIKYFKTLKYLPVKEFKITNDYETTRIVSLYKNRFAHNNEKIKILKDKLRLSDWDYECISNDYLDFISKYSAMDQLGLYKTVIKPIKDANLRLTSFVETLESACDDLGADEITISKKAISAVLDIANED